ncbi:MAG: DUF1800 family protein [Planctomycetes bacterium]|nr:DUF1800 family protein [Planctomycetota bacterium]
MLASPHLSRSVSRRGLFGSLIGRPSAGYAAAAAALASLASTSEAEPVTNSVEADPNALLNKLIRRTTFGITQADQARAVQLGYAAYLEEQLNYLSIDDSAMDSRLASYTTLNMTVQQLLALAANQVTNELIEALILRATFSKRQLFERMVEFWTDHFSIDINVQLCRYLKTVDERTVIRPNALGSFPAMLHASAQSSAMLLYLDNNTNIAASPNENYARELMELHTLSVTGPYTQNDVREVARCFTGWTFGAPGSGANAGVFFFNSGTHDNGQKTVLGNTIPAGGGMQDGITVLNILAAHPATANFIATKMCRKFLGENVSQSVINSVAAVYTSTNGDIKSMVREVLKPNNLATDYGPRHKRPFHHFVSAIRGTGSTVTATSVMRTQLNAAGNLPYNWGPPDGYPDTLAYWNGLILPRWNWGASMATNAITGISFPVETFFAGMTTSAQMLDKINAAMFGGEMPAAERTRLQQYLNTNVGNATTRRETVGLAIGAPSFQWY